MNSLDCLEKRLGDDDSDDDIFGFAYEDYNSIQPVIDDYDYKSADMSMLLSNTRATENTSPNSEYASALRKTNVLPQYDNQYAKKNDSAIPQTKADSDVKAFVEVALQGQSAVLTKIHDQKERLNQTILRHAYVFRTDRNALDLEQKALLEIKSEYISLNTILEHNQKSLVHDKLTFEYDKKQLESERLQLATLRKELEVQLRDVAVTRKLLKSEQCTMKRFDSRTQKMDDQLRLLDNIVFRTESLSNSKLRTSSLFKKSKKIAPLKGDLKRYREVENISDYIENGANKRIAVSNIALDIENHCSDKFSRNAFKTKCDILNNHFGGTVSTILRDIICHNVGQIKKYIFPTYNDDWNSGICLIYEAFIIFFKDQIGLCQKDKSITFEPERRGMSIVKDTMTKNIETVSEVIQIKVFDLHNTILDNFKADIKNIS
jgi:hypothetical protein